MLQSDPVLADPLFEGDGEMRALCRAFDWSTTPLGPPAAWPTSLRTIVSTLLATAHPMLLFWGPELVQFYNDAFRPSLSGERHPRALGMSAREFWTDVWDIVGPQLEAVIGRGEAFFYVDQLVPIERHGRMEEVYWTYSYSPVLNDTGGNAGILVVCQETTRTVVTVRRMQTLHNIATSPSRESAAATLRAAGELLAGDERDVPFLLCYARQGDTFSQACAVRGPATLLEADHWPLERACNTRSIQLVELPAAAAAGIGPWPEAPRQAAVIPLEHPATNVVIAVLVMGISARLNWDAGYEQFARSAALDIAQQLAAVQDRLQMEALRSEAEAANRAKSDFLAVMSHELRTPLNAISGYVELMEMGVRGPITDLQREDLSRIQASQRHLLGIINEVLNYAKLERGNVWYEMERIPVHLALTDAESLLRPQLNAKGLTLIVDECATDVMVYADQEKLRQVLVNLLSNALKFTPHGGAVRLGCTTSDGEVRIAVHDTGIGIPADKLELIFEPFVQVRPTLTRTAEGTGLGLAISRDLARAMGGDLVASSALGEGSVFTLILRADA